MASTDLLYRFLGIDAGAGAQFDRMAAKTELLGNSSKAAYAKVAMLSKVVLGAGVVIGVGAVKMAGDFQASMLRIQTQANGSSHEVKVLSDGILKMAGSVATTPVVLADAAYHIASIGQGSLTTAQQLRVLRIATEGAKIGGANLTDVTNALDAAIVSHIRGVKNYSQAMGVLNSTVGAGDMSMQDLADAFGPLGAVMKGYNVDIKQVGAALATFGDNNLRGAIAGTQLRMAVQALAVPVKAGQDQLVAWGIKAGNLSKQLEHGGLTSALDTLMHKMRENGVTAKEQGNILTQTFGKRAGVGLSVLEGQLGRFHTKLGEVGKGATGFASSWAAYTKSFGYAWDSAKASAEALMVELGEKLLPIATRLMRWISGTAIPALGRLMDYFKKNSDVAKGFAIIIGGLAVAFGGPITAVAALVTGFVVLYKHSETFREVVQSLGRVLASFAGWISNTAVPALQRFGDWLKKNESWTKPLAIALAALGVAIMTGPIGAVAELIVGLVILYKRSAAFRAIVKVVAHDVVAAWEVMKTAGLAVAHALGNVWEWFANGPLAWVKGQIRAFTDWYNQHAQAIKEVTSRVWDAIKVVMVTAWRVAVAIIRPLLTGLVTAFHVAWTSIKDVVGTAFKIIEDVFNTFRNGVQDFIGFIVNIITGRWGKAWDDAKKLVSDAFNGIGQIFKDFFAGAAHMLYDTGKAIIQGLINGIKDAAKALWSEVKSLASGIGDIFSGILGIFSPSKVFYRYGIWIVEGLVNGVKTYTVRAKSVAKELAIGFITGWKNGSASLKDALTSPVQRALERFTTVIEKAIARQAAVLKKAQATLHSALAARRSAISSLAGSISSGADLSGLFGQDAQGNPVTANVNTFLGGQRKQLENFARDLKWAAHHGLSNALLSEIAGLGAVQGDQVLQQFKTGAASITAADRAEAAIQRFSRSAASTVEDRLYAKRLAADRKEVREQTGELKRIRQLMEREERHLAKQVSTHLTIDARTGRPTVDKRFIDDIVKGIKRAERIAGKKLV